ncbi:MULTISPECIES: fluoride efflux transporter CrcB [unclassified Streptomyces]|uniref:fluoride efflux transporter CrcB n=1 Tax=unclassified Streptomyces TaxID=2593676 RepID=UPI0036F4FB8A
MAASPGRIAEPADRTITPPPLVPSRVPARGQASVIAAVALGGGLGAAARYGVSLLWPTPATGFPWATLAVNTAGCAAIGVLMVIVTDVRAAHRLVRPFFGTGVLGGFTTFSTYAVDVQRLVADGHARTGLAYLAATVPAAIAAVWCGAAGTRRLLPRRRA